MFVFNSQENQLSLQTPKNDDETIENERPAQKPIATLGVGDMIGYMALIGLPGYFVWQ